MPQNNKEIVIKRVNISLLLLFSLIIMLTMLLVSPKMYGDGNEYVLMLESLNNHATPDLRQIDIDSFSQKINYHYYGYAKTEDGRYYAQHFWAYSLSSVPTKLILDFFNINPLKSLQITNAVLFILLLYAITFVLKASESKKLILILLTTFSPILWFIHWTHAEVFIFVFISLSLIFLNNRKYGLSVFCAVVASFQNQAIMPLVLFMLAYGVYSNKRSLRSILKYGIISSLALLPNVFYYAHFQKTSLLANSASLSQITIERISEIFLDLNIGLVNFIPVTLLLFFIIIFHRMYKEKKINVEFWILATMLATISICSATYNWNHGTSGPSRYGVIILPLIFYAIMRNTEYVSKSYLLKWMLVAAVFVQIMTTSSQVLSISGNVDKYDYIEHSAAARFILNNAPYLYNPSFEIFCERTMNSEQHCNDLILPIVYKDKNSCRKALLTCSALDTLKSECGIDARAANMCKIGSERNEWFYINY